MHITQPATSRLIADLEYTIGYTLFRREKKRLSPTSEALALFEEVDRSFIGIGKIAEAAMEIGNFQRGSLHLASLPALALGFLPRIISQFSADKPDISIRLQIHSSQRVVQCVASQQFDIGLTESQPVHAAVNSRLLCNAPMLAILPRNHALLKHDSLAPEHFEGENFVLAVGNLVASGAGVSIIDHVTACNLRDLGLIETRPFLPDINFQYYVLLPSHKPLSRLGETFLDIAQRHLENVNTHQDTSRATT